MNLQQFLHQKLTDCETLFEQANTNSDIIYMKGMLEIGGIQTQLIANIGKRQAYTEVLEYLRQNGEFNNEWMENNRQSCTRTRTKLHTTQQNNSKTTTPNTHNIRKNHHTKQQHRTTIPQNHKTTNPNTTKPKNTPTRHRTTKPRNKGATTMTNTMDIIIDSREQKRIPIAKKYYESQRMNVSIKELNTGDYLFDNQVVMEFKTWPDFIASITDNRLFNETISQMEEYKIHFLVLHGTNRDYKKALEQTGLEEKHITGAIARLLTYTKIIRSTGTITDTFQLMKTTAEKCLDNKTICKGFGTKSVNPAFNVLCFCVDDINSERAKAIVNTLELKTFKDVCNLTYKDLLSVPGIGDKLATNILTATGGNQQWHTKTLTN